MIAPAMEVYDLKTGEKIKDAIFTDYGNVLDDETYVSKINIGDKEYRSTVHIAPDTPMLDHVRYVTDLWNFMKAGLAIRC